MEANVLSFMTRHQLLADGDTVVVGVSGGPDSMALLAFLYKYSRQWQLRMIVVSCDHGFRGEESAADVAFVRRWCEKRQLTVVGRTLDVTSYMEREQLGLQQAARHCRYDVFAEVMQTYQADKLVLAHHGDDQVETMLMNQVRGSYFALSGMPVQRPFASGEIIRPFLCVAKQEIEAYCKAQNIRPRRDPSNDKDDYMRNRFRHHILPFLKEENPRVHEKFQYESERIADDQHFLQQCAATYMDRVLLRHDEWSVHMSRSECLQVPKALQRRVIRLLLNYLNQETFTLQTVHIETILEWLSHEHPSGQLNLPEGLRAIRSYDEITLTYENHRQVSSYEMTLTVPGVVQGIFGYITARQSYADDVITDDRHTFVCDSACVTLPLSVRSKVPGDRMSLKGMTGSKKLKDIFIDYKIPRQQRSQWPVVCDASGRILWLPGLQYAGIGEATEHTRQSIWLQWQYKNM